MASGSSCNNALFTSSKQLVVESRIGTGAFGHVFKVRPAAAAQGYYALKKVDFVKQDRNVAKMAMREGSIMAMLQEHPYIVSVFGCFSESGVGYVVMELLQAGKLKTVIHDRKGAYFDESRILKMAAQLALAVLFVHDNQILHRDIKSEHVFIDDQDNIKLGGFGHAKSLADSEKPCLGFAMNDNDDDDDDEDELLGTPTHMAPELWRDAGNHYTFKTDAWAYGVVLYEICALTLPFKYAKDISAMYNAICHEPLAALPSFLSPDLSRMVVEQLLNRQPLQRASMADVIKLPAIHFTIQGNNNAC